MSDNKVVYQPSQANEHADATEDAFETIFVNRRCCAHSCVRGME